MPRPMLKIPRQQMETYSILSATSSENKQKQMQAIDKMKLDRLLRKKRSKAYMEAMQSLDAGGHVHNQHKVEEIINAIKNEFPEVALVEIGLLLGIVAICYLGDSYEVHSLDITGSIVHHYKRGESMPYGLERARVIAMRGGFEFIEVYTDCLRAVSADGTVSVINC